MTMMRRSVALAIAASLGAGALPASAMSAPQVQVSRSQKKRLVPNADGTYRITWGYPKRINGSTPKDRRASTRRRNKLRSRGHHRKAVK